VVTFIVWDLNETYLTLVTLFR